MMYCSVNLVSTSGLILGLMLLGGYHVKSVAAQPVIKSDQTLNIPTQVKREPQNNQFLITGGTQKGGNLFHSFQNFSLLKGQTASFLNIPPNIKFVINRVTGLSPSSINGGIQLRGMMEEIHPASFILLNPRGIEFGSNASLELGGSFIASTAKSIQFENGGLFKTDFSGDESLLTISAPRFFHLGSTPQPIRLVGTDPNITVVAKNNKLKVRPKQAFILIGGEIQFENYQLGPFSDVRLELASLSGDEFVQLETVGIPRLHYSDSTAFLDSYLSQQSYISVESSASQGQSKGLYVHSNRLTLDNESRLGGEVPLSIEAKTLALLRGSNITSLTLANQPEASVTINVDHLRVDQSIIQSFGGGGESAGNLKIEAKHLILFQGGQLFSTSKKGGRPGLIDVKSETIELKGGVVRDTRQSWRASGIISQNRSVQASSPKLGNAIEVTTQLLSLKQGGQISAGTFNANDAGNISITAQDIEIEGDATNPDGSLFIRDSDLNLPTSSGLFTSVNSGGTGTGGDLTITTNRLVVRDGGNIQAASFGSGDAGQIKITADLIAVSGEDFEGRFPTTIFAGSGGIPGINSGNNQATGSGNDIGLTTRTLLVSDGAAIAVGSLNPNARSSQTAGNLNISAETVTLNRGGKLISETSSGNGGNISLTGYGNAARMQELFLLNSSQISATAGVENAGGDGGDIRIASETILANPEIRPDTLGSDISANAFNGSGGNIDLNTDLLIGLQPRPIPIDNPRNQLNDIDASSQLGAPGNINISANLVDPTQALAELPVNPRIPKVARQCDRQSVSTSPSSLIDSGKGGLAKSPTAYSQVLSAWEDLRVATAPIIQTALVHRSVSTIKPKGYSIIEAQGLTRSQSGQLVLVAETTEGFQHVQTISRCSPKQNFKSEPKKSWENV